jgi:hypothetical protein
MTFRCGDIVQHGPTGERWVVAYVDGDRLGWCGWPEGEALISDCTLIKAANDVQHRERLEQVAASKHGKRARMAAAVLTAMAERTR